MLGDDAIPACGWCEDGITLWFDWLAMDAYDNKYFGQWFMVTQLSVIRLMNNQIRHHGRQETHHPVR